MIEISHLKKTYHQQQEKVTALEDVSLTVKQGEVCSIIGPSGCGKTTLIYILSGIINEYEGSVFIQGLTPKQHMGKLGLILQDYGLLPWKTVRQNVSLGLEIRKKNKKEITEKVDDVIHQVGLYELINHYPSQLSGGQRQRVAIARAISMETKVLLMDEPFSALDAISREETQEAFLELWRKTEMTVVVVTHSIEEAVFLGNKVLILSSSPGRIIYDISNPHQGNIHLRSHPDFQNICSEIRRRLRSV